MMKKEPYPSEMQDRFIVRLPDGMRDKIAEIAKANGRSMNAEIVARLEPSFLPMRMCAIAERRKLEIVADYIEWCSQNNHHPMQSFGAYADAYIAAVEHGDQRDGLEPASGVETIDPQYLGHLYKVWLLERPTRYPQLADTRSLVDSTDLRHPISPGRSLKYVNPVHDLLITAPDSELLKEMMRRLGPGITIEFKKN